MKVHIYQNTNFGNNDLVWNVPDRSYNFDYHQKKTFENYNNRFPLLTTRIVINGTYEFDTVFYDYMILEDEKDGKISKTYYFINTIVADRNALIFSVTLDVLTTYGVLNNPISGTIVRKHDTNHSEKKFDYPMALDFEGNFTNETYSYVGYSDEMTRLIESTINLKKVSPSINIPTSDNSGAITLPVLPKPEHTTDYTVTTWDQNYIADENKAFTLYLNDLLNEDVLNTVRGLSGDGAISDSYSIPSEAVVINSSGSEVTGIRGRFLTKTTNLKLEIDFAQFSSWKPDNEAIKGMFKVAITSMQEKTKITFPAWDLQESVDNKGFIKVNLWCDPKPSGAPYCSPDQVLTLYPKENTGITTLATLEVKSVRGGQWLRNPLIYSSAKGELFSTIETQLQREQAEYEKKVAMHQLELSKRERDVRIAQSDYNYQSGVAANLIGGGASLLTGDFGSAFSQAKGVYDSNVNQTFVKQMQDLQSYEQESEKTLIKMAHSNNLKNLNIQESIRRIVPREVVYAPNESLGSFKLYNGFTVSLIVPDIKSLQAKDMEYTKYGYPVFEPVNHFFVMNNLRYCHTVYQFENPLIDMGGQVGDMARAVLTAGIRVLSMPYNTFNIMNNPKRWN